jgi:ParB-like chromosome segregation protein Spo0J
MKVHPFSAASPELDADTTNELTASIRLHGQLVPILVWRGDVLDGRKRLAICEALGITPKVEVISDDADAARVAVDANVLRTHYTASQRAMFAASIATATPADAVNMRRDRTKRNSASYDGTADVATKPVTIRDAATLLNAHASQVTTAKQLQREAAPEVVDAVRRGQLTLHAAKTIASAVPKEEQARVTAEVVANTHGKRNTPGRIISAAASAPGIRNLPMRNAAAAVERGVNAMLATGEALEPLVKTAVLSADQRESITHTIKQVLALVRRITHTLTVGDQHERQA